VKLGLQNMKDMQRLLGVKYTDKNFGAFHVAGTNGKGSVCWKLAKAMESIGLRVGLFSSPHISSFRERITVNGEAIQEKDIEMLLPPVIEICAKNDIPATFFELTTIISMGYFNMQEVDFAVYEVGLGGRLDSTNVLSPDVSVITSISLDHTQILGETIEEIAREKGGIIKNGTPIVAGPNCPHHVLREMLYDQQRQGSPSQQLYIEVPPRGDTVVRDDCLQYYEEAATAAVGANSAVDDSPPIDKDDECDYNAENYDIALMALKQRFHEIDEMKVQKALLSLPPCRFQRLVYLRRERKCMDMTTEKCSVDKKEAQRLNHDHRHCTSKDRICESRSSDNEVEIVLDVAHNEDAFRKLFAKVRRKYPRVALAHANDGDIDDHHHHYSDCSSSYHVTTIMGLSSTKDVNSCIKHILMATDRVFFVNATSERVVARCC